MPGPIAKKTVTLPPTVNGPAPDSVKVTTSTPTVNPAVWTGVPQVGSDQFKAVVSNATQALLTTGNNYELIPGRYPNAVSLPQLLKVMGSTPEGQASLAKVIGAIQAKTGMSVPPEMMEAIKKNPAALTKALEMTPGQLMAGFQGLNAAYKAGKLKKSEAAAPQLPQKFDLANLKNTNVKRPESDLKQIAPGIFQGDLKSDLPDAKAKNNIVTAEIFQRLSANASAPADKQFSVKYGTKEFTRVDDFLKALKADGYQVNVKFEQRIANFAALKTVVPGSNPPKFVDVPAPVMAKTGIKDAQGREATVPVAHSEMVVSIKAGPKTKGPKLDADIKFYQGTGGTGFFPCDVMATPEWCGKSTLATVSGDKALKAIKVAGAFTDLVNSTAATKDLYMGGYGVTGVCNDSVAIVEQAVTGKAHEYPLLMNDAIFKDEINKRLTDADKRDDPLYQSIATAIRQLPTDNSQNATTRQRALASLPWAAGREPFQSSVDARAILSGN